MTRFMDASLVVYAYLKPKRRLSVKEIQIKEDAKKIVSRIGSGERVVTSTVHISEIANIVEDHMRHKDALEVERTLLFGEGIDILSVTKDDMLSALAETGSNPVGLSDALAYALMKKNGIEEIYSFDSDFDRFADIERVTR